MRRAVRWLCALDVCRSGSLTREASSAPQPCSDDSAVSNRTDESIYPTAAVGARPVSSPPIRAAEAEEVSRTGKCFTPWPLLVVGGETGGQRAAPRRAPNTPVQNHGRSPTKAGSERGGGRAVYSTDGVAWKHGDVHCGRGEQYSAVEARPEDESEGPQEECGEGPGPCFGISFWVGPATNRHGSQAPLVAAAAPSLPHPPPRLLVTITPGRRTCGSI